MNKPTFPIRLFVLALGGLLGPSAFACSDDSEDPPVYAGTGATTGGASGTTGGGAAMGGSAAMGGGGSGASDANVGGAAANGSGGMTGGAGAMDGSAATSGGGSGGSQDSGDDSGNPDPTGSTCRMITPAAEPGNECPDMDPVALDLTPVRTGLSSPIFVTHAPGDDSRLFVVERGGTIQILDPEDGTTTATFLDISDQITAATTEGGEYGMLGLAFHPDYPDDPRFFVHYMTDALPADPGTAQFHIVVASFEVSGTDPNAADEDSEQPLIDFADPASNHNGGMLAFGADDCLYIASGDGGGSNDSGSGHVAGGNGQSLDTPLGKILRVDVDDVSSAAPGNLAGGYMHIWDYGVRNPWRFSFDRETGDLYMGDVGQNLLEEVNVAPAGVGHHNYGWPIMEGFDCFGGSCPMDGLDLPVDDYPHVDMGDNCIIGGYVYRGAAIPSLRGWYLYADHGGTETVRALVWDGEGQCDAEPINLTTRDGLQPAGPPTSFGEDADGEVYMTTSNGGLYRITAE